MLTVHQNIMQPHPHQLGAALHSHHHRRNPSAPTLSVQPTNVPGLFSLGSRNATQTAKAAREPKQSKQQRNKDAASPTSDSSKTSSKPAAVAAAPVSVDSAVAVTPPVTPASATATQRGRKQANPTPKRTPSQQAQIRRHKEHQADPVSMSPEQTRAVSPVPQPQSPKEQQPQSPPRKQQRPTHQRNNTAPTSPVVATSAPATATPAAAKIARRRNRVKSGVVPTEDELLAATAPITTPASKNKDASKHLSRSAPLAVADWDTPLSIDIHSAAAPLASGPRTAPLDKAAARFNFGPSYSPPPSPTPNRHGRSPSVPINGIFDMEDDLHMPHSKSAGSSPSVPMARRVKAPGAIHQFGGMSVPFTLLNSAANISAPGDLDHPSMDPRFKWASSSFQTGPATRVLPAPGL